MNGPLIFTVIHIIKALECAEQQDTSIGTSSNDTKLERGEANATNGSGGGGGGGGGGDDGDGAFRSDQPDLVKLVKKTCSCPCNAVPKIPVCGRTTNGLSKTFDSQCHLMCHNQCDGAVERYAITFFGSCPVMPALNRKNVFSNAYENRRIENLHPYHGVVNPIHLYEDALPALMPNAYAPNEIYEIRAPSSGYAVGTKPYLQVQSHHFAATSPSDASDATKSSAAAVAYTSLLQDDTSSTTTQNTGSDGAYGSPTSVETGCDCSHCPETRWIRLDYYPICGERNGQRRTFDSWCHFDCENKCVRRTGDSFLYMHKGACAAQNDEEVVLPRTVNVASAEVCAACSSLCRNFFEPVCAKNGKNEYLSFKSRCHVRCHNQCHYQRTNEKFMPIYEGPCSWL